MGCGTKCRRSTQRTFSGLQGIVVNEIEVLNPVCPLQMPFGDRNQLTHIALSRAKFSLGGEQTPTDDEGPLTLFLTQISVAAAHRESVGFTDGGNRDNLDRKIGINCHATNNRTLLKILLPEKRDIRLHHVEQLGNNRCYTAKMPGPEAAAEWSRELPQFDESLEMRRIDFPFNRRKHNCDTSIATKFLIAQEISRIGAEILARPELSWIDKDTNDTDVTVLSARPDKRHVTIVQIAHGRHKSDALSARSRRCESTTKLRDRCDGLHCST